MILIDISINLFNIYLKIHPCDISVCLLYSHVCVVCILLFIETPKQKPFTANKKKELNHKMCKLSLLYLTYLFSFLTCENTDYQFPAVAEKNFDLS